MVKTFRGKRNDGLYRKFVSKVYNFLFTLLFPGVPSNDINSKPKMLTRQALDSMLLTSDDWFIDAEIMINIRRRKMNFSEFPVEFREITGRSSFVKFPAIFEFLRNLLIFRIKEFVAGKHDA